MPCFTGCPRHMAVNLAHGAAVLFPPAPGAGSKCRACSRLVQSAHPESRTPQPRTLGHDGPGVSDLSVTPNREFKTGVTDRAVAPTRPNSFWASFPPSNFAIGFCLNEASAICRFLSASAALQLQLRGFDPEKDSQIDQYVVFSHCEPAVSGRCGHHVHTYPGA